MANLQSASVQETEVQDQSSSWRSFGSVASALIARAEAQQARMVAPDDLPFVPIAWAAE